MSLRYTYFNERYKVALIYYVFFIYINVNIFSCLSLMDIRGLECDGERRDRVKTRDGFAK